MRISLIALNARYIHANPAPYCIRQELETRLPGCEIRLHQLTINDPYYDTLLRITDDAPYAVFLSVYVWNSHYVRRLAGDLLRAMPQIRIVLGGPEAPSAKGETNLPCTLVRGEIERVTADFFTDLAADTLAEEYGSDPKASAVMPATPYRVSDFAETLNNRHIYYEASRGCPYSCSYCLSAAETGLRLRETAEVKADLEAILRHRPKIVRFIDRTFNVTPARSMELWQFLAKRTEKTLFHFEVAPDCFTDDMFEFLGAVEPGRFQFEIGLQSTHPATLAAVNRRMDVARALSSIRRLADAGNIHLHVDLILGLPEETAATFRKSFNDIYACLPHYLQMGLLKVLPDTPLSCAAENFDITCCADPPYSILANRWLDHAALKHLYRLGECVEAFYNNRFFRTVLAYVRRTETDPFAFFEQLLAVCLEQGFFNLAATQELMSRMLLILAGKRRDGALFEEMLRYDWLRSGHRFLPPILEGTLPLAKVRDHLWTRLPQNYAPLFDHKCRDEFFKQAVFMAASEKLLRETALGTQAESGFICFLPEEADRIMKLKKTVFIPATDALPPFIPPI